MNAQQVYEHILAIAGDTSRTQKTALLEELVSHELGRFVIAQAYDPFITYGIKPVMPTTFGTAPFSIDEARSCLDRLANRSLTGNEARSRIDMAFSLLDEAGCHLLYWILSKDLKAGIATATIIEVAPNLIPVFSVMRAQAFEERFIKKWPVIVEPKYDGFRVSFLCRNGNGGFFTRSGKRMEQLDHLVEGVIEAATRALIKSNNITIRSTLSTRPGDLARYARDDLNFMLDGEAITGSFKETSGDLRRKGEHADATFIVFDIMSYADFDAVGSVGLPYMQRRALVEEFISFVQTEPLTKSERYFANSIDETMALYNGFRARQLEGAMVKMPEGLYDKKKSRGWLKIKPEETEDLPIVGFFNGEPGTRNEKIMGGAIFRRANGVHVRVGGGWSDALRNELWEDWKHDAAILGIDPEVGFKPGYELDPAMSPAQGFKLLGRLGEIEYHEVTPDGSLRHPRFIRFRDDKAGEVETKEAA